MAVRDRYVTGYGRKESDIPSSWWQAQKMLFGGHESKYLGGGQNTKTYVERRNPDFAIRLVNTDVVTFHFDGEITLNSGGWHTVTTKQRINQALPIGWKVWSRERRKNGRRFSEWWLYYHGVPVRRFEDGMRFNPDHIAKDENNVVIR